MCMCYQLYPTTKVMHHVNINIDINIYLMTQTKLDSDSWLPSMWCIEIFFIIYRTHLDTFYQIKKMYIFDSANK